MSLKINFPKAQVFLLACFCFGIFSEINAAEKANLSAGVAKVNITPQTPIPMSGYGSRKDPFQGVHDDIFARSAVFSDGTKKAVLLSVDVIGFSHSYWEKTTKRIENETGIPQQNILLAAVHNHAGPVTRVYVRTDSPDVLSYCNELEDKLVTIVSEANGNLRPVRIGAGAGECKMNINRRAQNAQGEITLGRNPYGPCDHTAGVVRIDAADGKPIALLINWPCHGTVTGPQNYLISGDWPGATSRYVEQQFHNSAVALVTAGASGDINPIYGPHIDFVERKSYSFAVDAIGSILGQEVIRVSNEINASGNCAISSSQKVISLPRKKDKTNLLQPEEDINKGVDIRLSVLKIGNIVLAGVSGELFNEIGKQVKEASPYKNTFVVTHCNGSSGYIVTDKAYEEGGYEASSTRIESGAEKAIVENLLAMINDL
ncbi:MAG: neutral/alkaline non-lysosomal ceramidase N-terminal domain-containing protein [Candidatus Latescibacteria bacterium]|nr:neutral/alkaline non-lysosomal ceramidase N-terminal domain-containing protein [Candidatus Latescibacterota bacterium]